MARAIAALVPLRTRKKPSDVRSPVMKSSIARIGVGSHDGSALGIGARDDQRRHAEHVRSKTRRNQFLNRRQRRDQHFTAQMPALFRGRQLVLEMNRRGPRLDHRLHQLEGVQISTKSRFGVGHQRSQPVGFVVSFGVVNLIRAQKRVVQAANEIRHAIRRIQALIGIGLRRVVGISRHLPPAHVNRIEPRCDLLYRLISGHRAQGRDKSARVQQIPESFRAKARECVLDVNGAAQLLHILLAVGTRDPRPPRVLLPIHFQTLRPAVLHFCPLLVSRIHSSAPAQSRSAVWSLGTNFGNSDRTTKSLVWPAKESSARKAFRAQLLEESIQRGVGCV